jgi:hypothetical protein
MRTLLVGGAVAALALVLVLVIALSAGGGSSSSSASDEVLRLNSDLYEISQIERAFHEAISKKNIEMMVGLYAPHATGTFGPGKTATGRKQIRDVWLNGVAFDPETHWLSDHPAYRLKATVDGANGTLRFECHFVDVDTGKVVYVTAGSLDVAKIDGHWLITNFVGSTSELKI